MQVTFSDRRRLLLGLALALSFPLLASAAPPAAGQPAPALTAVSFAGANIDLAALRGKVVVLNFWASWCEPCRREMPLLDSLAQQYHERVVVLGLSADDRHDRKDAVNISHAVSYPTGMLAEAGSNGFGMPQVLPLTYHAVKTIVDDNDFDGEFADYGRRHFLHVHLDASIARDAEYQLIRKRGLGAHGGGESESHGAQPT